MKPGPCFVTALMVAALVTTLHAVELHVATTGKDSNPGTPQAPLRTIQRAADLAQPGDTITVHEGVYRELVNPPRGGTSDQLRIVYRAAPREHVAIKGSEVVKGWVKIRGDVWKVSLPNLFFAGFNPYSDLIHGDWFDGKKRPHHTGAVYLNGDWLIEAATLDQVLPPAGQSPSAGASGSPLWFGKVDETTTTIWAQFPRVNPNEQLVEINARQTVFYPDQPGRNFITVRGFTLSQAATPWAPPTAEQIGVIGPHWSQGWIIESNTVSYSICSGISLGKYGDAFDNTSADSAEGYVKTIERAHAYAIPWTRENIGHHIVRNNTISHCEQAGIVGSLGAAFSTVTGNVVHDIHVRGLFTGAEMAGIKFHGAIDTTIQGNQIYRCSMGLWLDWMAQGTRVSGNLFHDNAGPDLFFEVDHGPFVVDNNLFLSSTSLLDMSEGGAYAYNLFAGKITNKPEPGRETPYHPAHSTTVAGLARVQGGDDRFYNNLFVGKGEVETAAARGDLKQERWISSYGLWGYDGREGALLTGGNIYYYGAEPYIRETNAVVLVKYNPAIRLIREDGRSILEFAPGEALRSASPRRVTMELLGKARVPGLPYVNPDDSPLNLDTDYFGKRRDPARPTPGPFENPGEGKLRFTVWNSRE